MGKSKPSMANWPCHVQLQNQNSMTYQEGNLGGLLLTFMHRFCVLYHQTIIITWKNRVCQWWTMFALKSKSVLEIFQRSGDPNFKNFPLSALLILQTVKKLNLCEKTAVEKKVWIKAWYVKLYVFCLCAIFELIALQLNSQNVIFSCEKPLKKRLVKIGSKLQVMSIFAF